MGVPHRKAGLPSTCHAGPSGTVLPLLSSGRRLDTGPHLFTSSPPGAVRYTRGPGTSQSQPRSRRGCRAAEPSSTRCHRHEQARLCPAVKVTPKAAHQLAGRRARPRHGPALSFPQKHCSGHPPQHTQEGASSPSTQGAWATAPTPLSAGRYLLPGGLLGRDLSRAREPGEGDGEATPRRTGQGPQNYRGSPQFEAGTWRGRLGSPSMTHDRRETSVVLGSGSLGMDIAHLQTNLIQKQHLQRLCI